MEVTAKKVPSKAAARDEYEQSYSAYMRGPRHAFLKRCVPDVGARLLAGAVDKAMRKECGVRLRERPPARLPTHAAAPYAFQHTRLDFCKMFHRVDIQALCKKVDAGDAKQVVTALSEIDDALHDPERVCEAVRADLPQRLPELMLCDDTRVRERACRVVQTLAGDACGREALLQESGLMPALMAMLHDRNACVRLTAASALQQVVVMRRSGCVDLNEQLIAPQLLALLSSEKDDDILALYLETIQFLLEYDETKVICIDNNAFNMLLALVESKGKEIAMRAKECLGRLTSGSKGKMLGDKIGLVTRKIVIEMLCSPDPELNTSAARLIMNLTHSITGKTAALSANLLEPLLTLAKDETNSSGQMYALQALSHLAEVSRTHAFLKEHRHDLLALRVRDELGAAARDRLLMCAHSD